MFCTIYFAAWTFDYLTCTTLLLLATLITSPKARSSLFPPAPLALVDSLTGDLTTPNSGLLASPDSATGAPENLKGEAVENEASNFVTALAAIAINIMSGKDPQGEPNSEEQELKGPMTANPDEVATMVASAKDKAEGVDRPSQDKTKTPMETIMWSKIPPMMHGLTIVCDLYEKFANLLSPSPPFHPDRQRLQLAGVVVGAAAISLLTGRDIVFRAMTFAIGVGLFCDPALKTGFHWMDKRYPNWYGAANINNSILWGVPTHPQLALALLRLGESKNAPLPPSPHLHQNPSHDPLPLTDDILNSMGEDQPLGATDLEIAEAAAADEGILEEAGGNDAEVSKSNSKEPHKALKIIKGMTKAGVRAAAGIDKMRAKTGNEGAKNRRGVIPSKKQKKKNLLSGPIEFSARYEGERGFLYLSPHPTAPSPSSASLAFNRESATMKDHNGVVVSSADVKPVWIIKIDDITDIAKHSGYGFKSKLAAGWAMDEELKDSLVLKDRLGESRAITAVEGRDALFNRLISVGSQKWEIW